MTAEQFAYWLQGFAELNGSAPTVLQWKSIREHLDTVFDKVTPPVEVDSATDGVDLDDYITTLPEFPKPRTGILDIEPVRETFVPERPPSPFDDILPKSSSRRRRKANPVVRPVRDTLLC